MNPPIHVILYHVAAEFALSWMGSPLFQGGFANILPCETFSSLYEELLDESMVHQSLNLSMHVSLNQIMK